MRPSFGTALYTMPEGARIKKVRRRGTWRQRSRPDQPHAGAAPPARGAALGGAARHLAAGGNELGRLAFLG
jgi:hypothetical protein